MPKASGHPPADQSKQTNPPNPTKTLSLLKVRRVREPAELFLHGLRKNYTNRDISKPYTNGGYWGKNIPDCTGVNTGVTLVNSLSKLLVSVALLICGRNGGSSLL